MTKYFFIIFIALFTLGCRKHNDAQAFAYHLTNGGNANLGAQKIAFYGCSSCHTIPGIRGANALVGPPLDHIGARNYIGGVLQNTPPNMMHWIQDAPSVDDKTAMPNVHVNETDARDIASYLYTLR